MSLWCAKDPDGKFLHRTLSTTRDEAVFKIFNELPERIQGKLWKNLRKSREHYRKVGIRVVKVKIIADSGSDT